MSHRKGFFSKTELTTRRPVRSDIPLCGLCGLYKTCKSPYMKPHGDGDRKIMVVGEAPGASEDEQGRPFVGASGSLLRKVFSDNGVDLDRDCVVTNSLVCRPPRNKIAKTKMIDWCRPNLIKALREHKPETVILLGSHAVRSLIGWVWKGNPEGVERFAGWQIPCQYDGEDDWFNTWIFPTYHPSHVLRCESERDRITPLLFERHLALALSTKGRPFVEPFDYRKQVDIVTPDRAAEVLDEFTKRKAIVAFDYETDRVRPFAQGSTILCAAASDGVRTVAFEFKGAVLDACKRLLGSSTPVVAANCKFEINWTRRHLGCGIKNVCWDTVVMAHCLDNRKNISSLKFQAFALLGAPPFDTHLEKFKKSRAPGGNSPNTLATAAKKDVLLYCGLDALLEWHVAHKQAQLLGMKEPNLGRKA